MALEINDCDPAFLISRYFCDSPESLNFDACNLARDDVLELDDLEDLDDVRDVVDDIVLAELFDFVDLVDFGGDGFDCCLCGGVAILVGVGFLFCCVGVDRFCCVGVERLCCDCCGD